MQDQRNNQVQAWLSQFDPASRRVVMLRYWHDLSYEEIAETISSTVGAIKSRLHRARETLTCKAESALSDRLTAPDKSTAQHFLMVI